MAVGVKVIVGVAVLVIVGTVVLVGVDVAVIVGVGVDEVPVSLLTQPLKKSSKAINVISRI
ncbi:MAG: hypothetical protein K1X79_12825 [Oligoflexia bacterium]|nr:hypothetical protein [Oligoflexia bacterium]